jgi:hypothetical protein
MLQTVKSPKNKIELIRSIQTLYNPKIETFDILDRSMIDEVIKRIKSNKDKKGFSVVLILDP